MIKKFYTLREFSNISSNKPSDARNLSLNNILRTYDTNLSTPASTELNTVFQQYLYPRNYNSFVTYISYCEYDDVIDETELVDEAFVELAGKVAAWINRTINTYGESIKLWNQNKAKLLEGAKSQSNFSETPQVEFSNYDDNYTNTRTVNIVDGPMIDKLNDINNKIIDIYNEWAEDFEINFVI